MDDMYLDRIKGYLKEWEEFKDLALTHKKLNQLQSNWNSLRDWLEKDKSKDLKSKQVLDKMNELEGVDNESN